MRDAFSRALVSAAEKDERIVLLTGDHGYALFDEFRARVPAQYINAGVAEQNMVGVAAGLAKAGYKPVVYGLSSFVPIRVLEYLKLDVCYEKLPVLIVGDGAGFVYSILGVSHQSAEDVASVRALPNVTILSPADAWEMQASMAYALTSGSPIYMRMGKADLGPVHRGIVTLREGALLGLRAGAARLAIIGTGSMVHAALDIGEEFDASVFSAPFLKPLSTDQVVRICEDSDHVVVLEEHSIYGGLGSAIAEIAGWLAPTRILRVGVEDRFSATCGSYRHLLSEHGLDEASIRSRIRRFIQ